MKKSYKLVKELTEWGKLVKKKWQTSKKKWKRVTKSYKLVKKSNKKWKFYEGK